MKNYIINGSLQGIGLETLRYFASQGCNVISCAHKITPEFSDICAELENEFNVKVYQFYCDFNNFESIKNLANEIRKLKVRIDGIVNLVGVAKDANFQMVKSSDLLNIYNLNVVSNLYFTQLISKVLIRQQSGSVLFVSSISAIDGNEGQLSYSSSKGALISSTKTLAKELGPHKIRVNCIAPGVINTSMNEIVPEHIINEKISSTSLKRIGSPSEVSSVIYFLLSDESSFVTGQIIRIDGGM